MYSLIVFIMVTGFIVWTAIIDSEHIKKKQWFKDHTSRVYQRAAYFLSIAFFNPMAALAGIFLYVAIFDQTLNILLEKPLFYLGTEAKWDIYWSKRKIRYITFKVLCLMASALLFLI